MFTGTFSGTSPVAGLEAHNGGVVFAPLLSTARDLTLTVDGVASSISTSQLASIDTLNVYAQDGAVLDLSGVTSYLAPNESILTYQGTYLEATGGGSTINMPNLTVLHGATDGEPVFLFAYYGGVLDLPQLAQIPDVPWRDHLRFRRRLDD
jgi:hypothetical protein